MAHIFRISFFLFAALLLPACSWLGFDDDDEDTSADRARRVTAIQSESAPVMGAPRGETMAERRLRSVYDKQLALYARLDSEGADLSDPEYDRLIAEVLTEYQSYLSDYPEEVHGFIFYGKMLRDIGQRDDANKAFLQANRLDENIAVVKQQIGNYLAEDGEPAVALAYYMSAAELKPDEPIYAYQIGELLYTYRKELIESQALEATLLDQQMIEAFAHAHQLNPSDRQLTQRYAEAYFDVAQPDWPKALLLWQALEGSARDPVERDWARLQEARVLIIMGRNDEARTVLNEVSQPGFQEARDTLFSQLPS
ncbi:hypothetical protein GCM10007047_07240 [Cerasicoccus arenae]|uniref:Tetratricopeptide repeat protein n=2 Tax=Cerasicoccus arenae TaxID=424488 RepID=A0A8J3D849_9BACT|nr:hypothetical protein GCM10007047_07240 [Cerasicoccus arenae]